MDQLREDLRSQAGLLFESLACFLPFHQAGLISPGIRRQWLNMVPSTGVEVVVKKEQYGLQWGSELLMPLTTAERFTKTLPQVRKLITRVFGWAVDDEEFDDDGQPLVDDFRDESLVQVLERLPIPCRIGLENTLINLDFEEGQAAPKERVMKVRGNFLGDFEALLEWYRPTVYTVVGNWRLRYYMVLPPSVREVTFCINQHNDYAEVELRRIQGQIFDAIRSTQYHTPRNSSALQEVTVTHHQGTDTDRANFAEKVRGSLPQEVVVKVVGGAIVEY